jgi:hypothetical protein
MKRTLILASILAVAFAASACGDDDNPNDPSTTLNPRFTAIMLAANETPPITTGPDAGTAGNAIVTLHLTKDGAGNITAATADFQVTLTGFTGSTITNAHIHQGVTGVSGGIVWPSGLASGEVVLTNGAGGFTKTNLLPNDLATAQAIIANPANFYFNIHSSVNGGGAVRGQLVAAP